MTADLIIKNANVFMTYRQCFEKRDVAVAGEKFYCVSPAIVYPGVKTIDARGKYMIPGFIDIHMPESLKDYLVHYTSGAMTVKHQGTWHKLIRSMLVSVTLYLVVCVFFITLYFSYVASFD